MYRLKLKNRRKNRFKTLVLIVLFSIFLSTFLVIHFGKKINTIILNLSEIECRKISKLILAEVVSKSLLNDINSNDIFYIEKDNAGNIQTMDLDSKKTNQILDIINTRIMLSLKELEVGKSSIVDIEKNLVTNTNIISKKEGVIFEIPMGIVTNNAFLSNVGPKIPIRVSLNGNLESEIRTSIENYGINNALFKVYLNIKISEQIIMPLSSKEITIITDVPIAVRMIQGNLPNYYFDNKTGDNN